MSSVESKYLAVVQRVDPMWLFSYTQFGRNRRGRGKSAEFRSADSKRSRSQRATSDIVGAHVRGTETGLCVLWKAGRQSCKFIEHEAFWRNFMVL